VSIIGVSAAGKSMKGAKIMGAEIIAELFTIAANFYSEIPVYLADVFLIFYDGTTLTDLGLLVILPLGLSLGWFGINFVIGLVKSAAGAVSRKGRK
jgi:hypothetical protein